MNVGGTLDNRFPNNLIHELDHRCFRIVGIEIGTCFDILEGFERAVGFQDFVERFRADAVERFHRAQDLSAGHEHPFGRLRQKLRSKLTAH